MFLLIYIYYYYYYTLYILGLRQILLLMTPTIIIAMRQIAITTTVLVNVGCTSNSSNIPTGTPIFTLRLPCQCLNSNLRSQLVTINILGTGYWHFKVEYKDKDKKDEGCKVTRIGGLS